MFEDFKWYPILGNHKSAWEGHILYIYNQIQEWKPKTVVELGVYLGHSLATMAEGCEDAKLDTKLYGVDHFEGDEHSGRFGGEIETIARQALVLYPNVTIIKSTFNDALEDWKKRDDTKIDLLHIDGRHFYEDIKEDFENWEGFVPRGGHIILHDTQVRERNFGIGKYFAELKREHPEWKFGERIPSHGLGIIEK